MLPAETLKEEPNANTEELALLNNEFRLRRRVPSRLDPGPPTTSPPWITLTYTPGFCWDLTSWRTWFGADGSVRQVIDVARYSDPIEMDSKHLASRLPPEKIGELRALIAACDFETATQQAEDQIAMTDLPQCTIWVQEGGAIRYFTSRLICEEGARELCALRGRTLGTELLAAWRLLRAIHEASPYDSEAD